jgi:hypothetical protein
MISSERTAMLNRGGSDGQVSFGQSGRQSANHVGTFRVHYLKAGYNTHRRDCPGLPKAVPVPGGHNTQPGGATERRPVAPCLIGGPESTPGAIIAALMLKKTFAWVRLVACTITGTITIIHLVGPIRIPPLGAQRLPTDRRAAIKPSGQPGQLMCDRQPATALIWSPVALRACQTGRCLNSCSALNQSPSCDPAGQPRACQI